MKRKDSGIESLRGLAVVLMVAGHVIGDTADVGLRMGAGPPLRTS